MGTAWSTSQVLSPVRSAQQPSSSECLHRVVLKAFDPGTVGRSAAGVMPQRGMDGVAKEKLVAYGRVVACSCQVAS